MSYRLGDPNPAYISLLGTETVAGGSLRFYAKGTTTPKDTYSSEDLDPLTINPNPLDLDAAGRAENEVWLDGEYTVILYDGPGGTGSTVWTRDVAPEVSPTTTLPDPTTLPGGTVKSNGTGYELVDDLALPDPTDSAGQMVVVNGDSTGYALQPIPEPEDPVTTVSTNSVTFGMDTGDKWMILKGTGTAPVTNTQKTSLPVSFSPPFKSGSVPFVSVTPLNTQADGGAMVGYADGAPTASGFTAAFDVAEGDSANANVTVAVNFSWIAQGIVDG